MPLSLGILYSISRATDDPRNGFRPANTTTEFAHLDLGLNKAFSFDAVVHQVETYTIPSQLGVEDASGDGSATRFQREYFNGHRKSSITAQFPVREDSGGLIGLESLSNNEATRLHMDIRNICEQNLGRDAQRRVKVVLWGNQPFAGDVDPVIAANYIMPHQLLFFTTDDNGATETHKLTYPGYTHEFPVLKPNRALTTFEGKFILENAPPYAGGEQRAAIFISDLHEPTGWRLVQQRAHKLRCEPQFKPDDIEGAIHVLLVCSTAISCPKYNAWHIAAMSLGLRVEVYPLTRYGHLDPSAKLPFGAHPKLGSYMTDGCLVVCLDNEFESIKYKMRPADTVAPSHLRAPGGGAPCHYLFVRGEQGVDPTSQAWDTYEQTRLLQRMDSAKLSSQLPAPVNSEEALLAEAMKVVATPDAQEMVHGVTMNDPFLKPKLLDVYLEGGSPQTNEATVNRCLMKQANRVKKLLLSVPHLSAVIVAYPAAGADWDEMQWTPSCCSHSSAKVNLPPPQAGQPLKAGISPSTCAARRWASRALADEYHVLPGHRRPAGRRLPWEICGEELARFGVVQSLPFASRMAALAHCISGKQAESFVPVPKAVREKTMHLIVLSLLGDCAAEMIRVLDGLPALGKEEVDRWWSMRTVGGFELATENTGGGKSGKVAPGSAEEAEGSTAPPMTAKEINEWRARAVVDQLEAPTWRALVNIAQHEHLGHLKGKPHAQKLAGGLAAMAGMPNLVPFSLFNPPRRQSLARNLFKALAQQVGDSLGLTADQIRGQAAQYTSELTTIKAAIAQHASSASKQRLAFVVPGYARRGAVVGTASKRMKKHTSALSGYSAKAAVLWRFSSAGVAKHDSLQGGSAADGNHAVHVRGTASLASVEVMSRSEFERFSSEAHSKQSQAQRWKAALEAHKKKDQLRNLDLEQEAAPMGEMIDAEVVETIPTSSGSTPSVQAQPHQAEPKKSKPKFCTGCGTPNTGSKFCVQCGNKLD